MGDDSRLGEAEKLFDVFWEMVCFHGYIIGFGPGFQVAQKDKKRGRYLLELGSIDDNFCDIFRDMIFEIPGTLGNIPETQAVKMDSICFGVDM